MKSESRPRSFGATGGERGTERLRQSGPTTGELAMPARAAQPPDPAARKAPTPEFNTAMIHFYRGEIQRSNTWRNRLDTTTNWAVLTAGATLSFAFGSPSNPHFVIPINSVLVAIFLVMEARRYRYYEIWSNRVRIMETGYFAQMLAPGRFTTERDWTESLASDLLTPHFTISEWEAIGRRLRRNYLWIFALLALCWNLKVYLHPVPAHDFADFIDRATIGVIPGWVTFIFGVVFNGAVLVFAVATVRLRDATGEVLPQRHFTLSTIGRVTGLSRVTATTKRAASRRAQRARKRVRVTGSLSGEKAEASKQKTEGSRQPAEGSDQRTEEETLAESSR